MSDSFININGRFNQFNVHAFSGVIPRFVGGMAIAIALVALCTLGGVYAHTAGTTATVTASFKASCLGVAKWSALVGAGGIGVSLITDIFFGIHQGIKEKSFKELVVASFGEAGFTLACTVAIPIAAVAIAMSK